jgi:AraC-like DNA-binding protein
MVAPSQLAQAASPLMMHQLASSSSGSVGEKPSYQSIKTIKTIVEWLDCAEQLDEDGRPRDGLNIAETLILKLAQMEEPILLARAMLVAAQCHFSRANHTAAQDKVQQLLLHLSSIGQLDADSELIKLYIKAQTLLAQTYYFQGLYSRCQQLASDALSYAIQHKQWALASFACLPKIMAFSSHDQFDASEECCHMAIGYADLSQCAITRAQAFNASGLHHYYRALAQVLPRHSATHFTLVEPSNITANDANIRIADERMTQAIEYASQAGAHSFAESMRANYQRIRILRGESRDTLDFLRRYIRSTQDRGAPGSEINARFTYAWALRCCCLLSESLSQLNAAIALATKSGSVNRILEALYYDHSIVSAALGHHQEAINSHARYVRLVSGQSPDTPDSIHFNNDGVMPQPTLEPFYLKQADKYVSAVLENQQAKSIDLADMAKYCGVSIRTLQIGFRQYRGTSPVSHIRNLRLTRAHDDLANTDEAVASIAQRHGFSSVTTFTLEYKRRFGYSPRKTHRQTITK